MSAARISSDVLELFYGPIQMENRRLRRPQQLVRITQERCTCIDFFISTTSFDNFFSTTAWSGKTFFVRPHTDQAQTTHTDLEDRPGQQPTDFQLDISQTQNICARYSDTLKTTTATCWPTSPKSTTNKATADAPCEIYIFGYEHRDKSLPAVGFSAQQGRVVALRRSFQTSGWHWLRPTTS